MAGFNLPWPLLAVLACVCSLVPFLYGCSSKTDIDEAEIEIENENGGDSNSETTETTCDNDGICSVLTCQDKDDTADGVRCVLVADELEVCGDTCSSDGKFVTLSIVPSDGSATLQANFSNYGARWVSWLAEASDGTSKDVIVSFETLSDFVNGDEPEMGATIGQYANRIADGAFSLDGSDYTLPVVTWPEQDVSGTDFLHGEWHTRFWTTTDSQVSDDGPCVTFTLTTDENDQSEDGTYTGFPSTLEASVTYTLLATNEIRIDYSIENTGADSTVVSVTNHAYFNLEQGAEDDEDLSDVNGYTLEMQTADKYSVDSISSSLADVADSYDFTTARAFGTTPYNSNFCFDDGVTEDTREVATLYSSTSGLQLTVSTDQPGIQVYTADFLSESTGKGGRGFGPRDAVCLETQHYPDSPNHDDYPTTTLEAGATFTSTTIYKIEVPSE